MAASLATVPTGAIDILLTAPTLDRWNYPFASNPGGSPYAAVFAPLTEAGFDPQFDNRDGQMLLGFNTAAAGIPANLQPGRYVVSSASVEVTVESNNTFAYDPTPDSYRTWLQPGDANFLPDSDPGRAVELFGTGFRHGETALTHLENDPYSPLGQLGKSIRSAYPLTFVAGACRDASNNVDEQFDPVPFAVGTTSAVAPGGMVPQGTVLRFEINVSDPATHRWLRQALSEGMVDFSIASIFPSEQQTTGTYPRFYTKENLSVIFGLVSAGRLQMSVQILDTPAPAADITGDGAVNVNDLLAVINAWGDCACCVADVTADAVVNVNDLLAVINAWG